MSCAHSVIHLSRQVTSTHLISPNTIPAENASSQVVPLRVYLHHCGISYRACQQLQRSHRHRRLLPLPASLQGFMGPVSGVRSILHCGIGESQQCSAAMRCSAAVVSCIAVSLKWHQRSATCEYYWYILQS